MANNNLEVLFASSLNELDLSDKQKSVLRASLTLFSEKGYDRTSTQDIASMAGVSEGTVYKQFKTKEGILNAILAPVIQQVFPKAADEFAKEVIDAEFPSLGDFLRSLISNRLSFVRDNRRQIRVLLQRVISSPEFVAQLSGVAQERIGNRLAVVMKHYRDTNQVVDWSIDRVLHYIIGIMISYAMPMILVPDQSLDVERVTDEIVAFLLKGLQPEK